MELFKRTNLRLFMITVLLSLAGVALFYIASLPLAWLLGPITVITLYKCFRPRQLYWPVPVHRAALILIGIMLGASFKPEMMNALFIHLPGMLVSTLLTIGVTTVFAYILWRHTDLDFQSSLLGSIPGGLSQILILSEDLPHVNHTAIAFMQITRILFVIFLIPFLAFALNPTTNGQENISVESHTHTIADVFTGDLGAAGQLTGFILGMGLFLWLAHRVRLPAPYLLGPIIGTVILNLAGIAVTLPDSLFMFAQLGLGAYMGLQIQPRELLRLKKMGLFLVIFNVLLIAFVLGLSVCLTMIYPVSFHTAFLGMSPGGIAEMGVTAEAVQADLAIVTGYQLFRLFFILFFCVILMKWWQKDSAQNESDTVQEIAD